MKVLHLIHETSFGGVESAAENLRLSLGSGATAPNDAGIRYRVGALGGAGPDLEVVHADVVGRGVNSPRAALRLLREIRRERPDVLITSLWRVVALGLAARVLSPRTRWVVWAHNSRYSNRADALVHRLALARADEVWSDSEASWEGLVRPERARVRADGTHRIIKPEAAPIAEPGAAGRPGPEELLRLVYWGRLARPKRLDLAIDLVAELERTRPGGARLTIIGPDAGARADLVARVERLGLGGSVEFAPAADRAGIAAAAARAHAFVQLSDFEGFAMSAHEALALGLVCVVTPVGDLVADTHDGVDSIHHHGDIADTARRLLDVMDDPEEHGRLAAAARAAADGGFVDSFAQACRDLAGRTE
ncbi:glycosyltransferase family 4 protein [Brachybacterium huguangmaarense]